MAMRWSVHVDAAVLTVPLPILTRRWPTGSAAVTLGLLVLTGYLPKARRLLRWIGEVLVSARRHCGPDCATATEGEMVATGSAALTVAPLPLN
jgi:hypothetical protein